MTNKNIKIFVARFEPGLLGFGLFWTWVFLCFSQGPLSNWSMLGTGSPLLAHFSSLLATIPVYLFATFAYKPAWRLLHSSIARIGMTLGIALGTLVAMLPALSERPALQLAGAVLTGLTSPWLLLLWGERYGSMEMRSVVIYTALSYLLVAILVPIVSVLSALSVIVITTAMPLASLGAYLTIRSSGEKEKGRLTDKTQDTIRGASVSLDSRGKSRDVLEELKRLFPLRMLLGFLAVMFIYGGALTFHGVSDGGVPGQPLVSALPPLLLSLGALCVGLFTSRQALSLGVAYRLALLLIAAVFIPLALLGTSPNLLSAFFASVGVNAIEIITWILLAYAASTVSIPRFAVFAACNVVFHIGMAAGELSGILLANHMLIFSLLSICALVALAGFAFTDRDAMIRLVPPSPDELGAITKESATLRCAVEGIAADFTLSEREREVLMLWSVGYGAKIIEKKLFISSSTVKTHIQHIYEKCGVHSRAEVISLLEERLSRCENI
jgi:DNA-binding CsgD family transcriptional regulator